MSPAEHEQQHKYLESLPTSDNQLVQRSAIHQVASDYVVLQQACDSFSKDSDAAELLSAEHVRETKSERSFWHRRGRSSHYVSTA